jgi:hypothetical protein
MSQGAGMLGMLEQVELTRKFRTGKKKTVNSEGRLGSKAAS